MKILILILGLIFIAMGILLILCHRLYCKKRAKKYAKFITDSYQPRQIQLEHGAKFADLKFVDPDINGYLYG